MPVESTVWICQEGGVGVGVEPDWDVGVAVGLLVEAGVVVSLGVEEEVGAEPVAVGVKVGVGVGAGEGLVGCMMT